MRWAQIEDGRVANVVEQEAKPSAFGVWVACGPAAPGWTFDGTSFSAPAAPPPRVYRWDGADLPPQYWQIDVGPFKDRFDAYGYAGLKAFVLAAGRTNDVCYAAFADLVGREFVDLKLRYTELRGSLDAIAAVVAAAGKPAFTVDMREAILKSPTTDYERHVKGLPQPL